MFDKYLYALGKGVRSIRKSLDDQRDAEAPDPAKARDITPPKQPPVQPAEIEQRQLAGNSAAPLPRRRITLGKRPLIMGIVNVTPDSFSDGGQFFDPGKAIEHGLQLAADGADILDIGGESTRPGFDPIEADEELSRVIPVIEALAGQTSVPLSIDTMKAKTAAAAIEVGASVINDVWGFQFDKDMARVAADSQVQCILMHNRDADDPDIDIFEDVRAFLARSIDIALAAGVQQKNIILDPGIGFGKTNDQSLEMVRRLGELKAVFDMPVLLGLSRKRLIGEATERASGAPRDPGTVAGNIFVIGKGADIIRVHNVFMHVDALNVLRAIGGPGENGFESGA